MKLKRNKVEHSRKKLITKFYKVFSSKEVVQEVYEREDGGRKGY